MTHKDKHKDQSSLRTLAYFYRKYPLQNTLVIAALVLAGLAETLGIGALLPLITLVVGGNGELGTAAGGFEETVRSVFASLGITPTLGTLLLIIILAISAKAAIVFMAMRYVSFMAVDISRQVRMRLINALMHAKWGYFSGLVTGHVANAISEQAQRAGGCYIAAGRAVAGFMQVLIYTTLAFFISFKISILAIVMGVLLASSVKFLVRRSRLAGRQMSDSMNDMLALLNESLSAVKPIKAMGQEERFVSQLEKDTLKVLNAQKRQYASGLMMQVIYEPMIVILMACGLYYVLTFTDTPVNGVFLLAFLFHRLMSYASAVQNNYQSMAQTESALWLLNDQSAAAEKEAEVLSSGGAVAFEKEISFEDLGLSYNGKDFLVRHFSETVPAGQVTLLFGPSGIGKTTLTDVVLGMHVPQEGQVLIDGLPLPEIDMKGWRHKTGYVPQDTFLFHDTIRQNVTLGDETFSDEDVEDALRRAAAWDFIKTFPDGIKTIVGERGGKLSGGQRQRIALARSLIRHPKLLILDEATTGLDAESEKLVFESIRQLHGKTTVIMISHNPALKELADKVIYLGGAE